MWTASLTRQLRAYAAMSLSAAEISDRLDVSRNAVIGKCHREGIALSYPLRGMQVHPREYQLAHAARMRATKAALNQYQGRGE